MKLKIPPVVQVIVAALAMWLIKVQFPVLNFPILHQRLIAGVLITIGLAITLVAVGGFRKAKTTVDPTAPAKAETLVIKGPYRFSRNPMYLGFLAVLCGWALALGNLAALIMPAIFVWYMNEFQIKPEEQALKEKFGADYDAYRKKVRRWL